MPDTSMYFAHSEPGITSSLFGNIRIQCESKSIIEINKPKLTFRRDTSNRRIACRHMSPLGDGQGDKRRGETSIKPHSESQSCPNLTPVTVSLRRTRTEKSKKGNRNSVHFKRKLEFFVSVPGSIDTRRSPCIVVTCFSLMLFFLTVADHKRLSIAHMLEF